jgi:hypothetical protein
VRLKRKEDAKGTPISFSARCPIGSKQLQGFDNESSKRRSDPEAVSGGNLEGEASSQTYSCAEEIP